MHFVPYRSRSELHKMPFGAVKAGEAFTLRVILPRGMGCRGVKLRWGDYDGAWERAKAFWWEGMQGEDEEWWQCRLTVDEPGLYRYRFAYDSDSGGGLIGDEGQGVGRIDGGDWWRLTVYNPALRLPEWVRGAVLYQIFPDRFCNSGGSKSDVPAGRVLREDWGGAPLWNPDAHGRITQYDFFGGDLRGIAQKLDYLQGLGVTCLYLNPIFRARSNHRYDTADYYQIDPLLGGYEDFVYLCGEAHRRGMRVLLDGVFSHTGADSLYFNKYHSYTGPGAYESQDSPYYGWYTFRQWPEDYACWWGMDILPELREERPEVLEFFTGEGGVVPHWLRAGADGWRLDVADELPDVFLDRVFECAARLKPDAYLLGEVWEDASCKWSHGGRRRFLLGGQMHSVMNYPLAAAILRFAQEAQAEQLAETVLSQLEHYPPCAIDGLMNHIGTHDTPRILTRLSQGTRPGEPPPEGEVARRRRLCAALQYTLPGNPCVYYGDEAGLEGAMDPFNRACYPWGEEDRELLDWYRRLGELKHGHKCFAGGALRLLSAALGCVAFTREAEGDAVTVIANANPHGIAYTLPDGRDVEVEGISARILCG